MPFALVHARDHQAEWVVRNHVRIEFDLRQEEEVDLHNARRVAQQRAAMGEGAGEINGCGAGLSVRGAAPFRPFESTV